MRRCRRIVLPIASGAMLLLAMLAGEVAAQEEEGLFEKLGLDRLRLTSIGLGYGPATPAKVEATHSFALQVDYGEIAPQWHVVFVAGYWESSFDDETVEEFVRQIEASIDDPSGEATLQPARVRVSAVSLELEGRYFPFRRPAAFQPYVGLGIGAHAINAESRLINDTFVESALDNISTGFTGVAGVQIAPSRRLSFGVQGRYTLLSTLRYGTLRALVSYHFARAQRPARLP